MKSFSFENQGTNTYLVYTVSADDSVDSMSLGMLTNNKIPGLAPAIFTQMDTTKYIKYNVSAHISVSQVFSGPVNKKLLLGVFSGIFDAMLSAEDYMIDTNSIIMDLDYIFADVSTCESVLICLPILDTETPPVDLGVFFKNIMFGTQFDQTENCDHVAKIMNYLNSTPVFSLSDFKELLNGLDTPANNAQPVVNKPQPVVTPPAKPAQEVKETVQPVAPQPKVEPAKPVQPVVAKPVQTPPVQTPPVQPVQAPPAQQETSEKKISMFDLLMHYSKENAALYKAQKEAAKTASPAQPAPVKAKPAAPQTNPGFAVPGQAAPANAGFAIPGQPAQPVAPVSKVTSAPSQPQPAQPSAPVAPKPVYQPPVTPQSQAMNFGETTVLGGGGNIGETTVLGAAPTAVEPKPYLIRSKNNEKINLDKPVFRIGKEKSYVDYFIGDNTAISRSHANVITRDGEYFVVDTNSTNHTYVNGAMIQSNVETKISHGDKVRLANEDFEFKLY